MTIHFRQGKLEEHEQQAILEDVYQQAKGAALACPLDQVVLATNRSFALSGFLLISTLSKGYATEKEEA